MVCAADSIGMIRKKVFTSMALLGCLSFIWLYISSERQRFKGHSSQDFKDTLSGSERSQAIELANIMASRQQERKRQLSAYCERTKTNALQPKDLNHFIVDNKHRIVYCYVPKVACTTWKKIMAHLVGLKSKPLKSVHDQKFNLLSSHSKAKARFILENYYKFLFVREPFERLLSAYKDKFTRKTNVWKKYEKKIKRAVRVRLGANATSLGDRGGEIKFQDFISYLIDVSNKGSRFNEHWRHYDQLCHPCKINFDFIGHYETLEDDASFVLHEAGVDQFVSFPPVHFTSTKNDLERYYSEVPQEDILRLQRVYRRDFELFEYKMSQSLGNVVNRTNANKYTES
ncbi:carbohydrate sulfotransferase 11-like [Oculina patagonica]